jgi:hypothetical protein
MQYIVHKSKSDWQNATVLVRDRFQPQSLWISYNSSQMSSSVSPIKQTLLQQHRREPCANYKYYILCNFVSNVC